MKNVGAGKYDRRYKWLRQSQSQETTVGSVSETFPDDGYLWGTMETRNADEPLMYGMKGAVLNARIRIRGYQVPLSFKDRLFDLEFNQTFFIDGVMVNKPGNELIVTAHSLGDGELNACN